MILHCNLISVCGGGTTASVYSIIRVYIANCTEYYAYIYIYILFIYCVCITSYHICIHACISLIIVALIAFPLQNLALLSLFNAMSYVNIYITHTWVSTYLQLVTCQRPIQLKNSCILILSIQCLSCDIAYCSIAMHACMHAIHANAILYTDCVNSSNCLIKRVHRHE